MLLPLSSLGLLLLPGSFVIFESEQVQPSLSDYYKDEPNPGYEPEKKREDRYRSQKLIRSPKVRYAYCLALE